MTTTTTIDDKLAIAEHCPWLRGITMPVADPIKPVDANDNRMSVKELLKIHSVTIEETKKMLTGDKDDEGTKKGKASVATALYDPLKHDDLWILRFVLSHAESQKNKKKVSDKAVREVAEAAKTSLEMRDKYDLDKHDIRFHPPSKTTDFTSLIDAGSVTAKCFQKQTTFMKENDAMVPKVPDVKRTVFLCLQPALMDQHKLAKEFPFEEALPAALYFSEWSFQWYDYITRTTGRLTRTTRFIIMTGISQSNMNSDYRKRNSQVLSSVQDCYPQLLNKAFICGAPTWLMALFKVVKKVMPKRLVSKMDFVAPQKNTKDKGRVLEYMSEKDLPDHLGGTNKTWADMVMPEVQ